VVPTGNADADMVSKLRASVLGASPIIGQFMQNVELVRPQFPNDESACMRAALAFTRVDKAALQGELNRTVAAAFLQAKKGTENERRKTRAGAVGSLEQELSTVDADIKGMQSRIAELQQSIATQQAKAGQLQGKVRDAEADLQRQDNVVNASFAQVEQYIASLTQTFAKL
jgi:predicted RNase H-like nuclease (RuvC/YqgF family)